MNPDPSKLRQEQQQAEETAELRREEKATGLEFKLVEDAIRFDAHQNPPPERIAERLKDSIAREPARPRSWWRRLFG